MARAGWQSLAGAGLLAICLSPHPARADESCAAAIGRRAAQHLVQQCLEVSPATHPPCNAENSCELIRAEIARGCALLGEDKPDYCEE
jgi:hypothetical protein